MGYDGWDDPKADWTDPSGDQFFEYWDAVDDSDWFNEFLSKWINSDRNRNNDGEVMPFDYGDIYDYAIETLKIDEDTLDSLDAELEDFIRNITKHLKNAQS